MRTKLMLIALLTCAPAGGASAFQNSARAEFATGRDGSRRVTALYNLFRGDKGACKRRTFTGAIVEADYDGAANAISMTLGTRGAGRAQPYFIIEALPFKDAAGREQARTLIAEGRRVRVDAYGCGARGDAWIADNVVAIGAPRRTRNR